MSSRDITVYLDERWCSALETHTGKTMEALLEEQMIPLIQQLPADQRSRITQEIQQEEQKLAHEAEANRRFSLTHITENGETHCHLVERGQALFQIALRLRRYLRGELQDSSRFYGDGIPITREDMEKYTAEMLRGSPRVMGLYDIDLDAGEIYSLNPEKGWRGYQIKDVSTAAYFAGKRESDGWSAKQSRFRERLEGKEISGIGRSILIRGDKPLPVEQVCFEGEVAQIDELLNFYVPINFDVDAVLGTHVNTDENDDWVNLYANYDMEHGCVCESLDVYLVRGSGPELLCEYRLTPEEQEALHSKMDSYCMEQMGVSLEAAREQYLAEEQSPQGQEPPQQTGPTLQM